MNSLKTKRKILITAFAVLLVFIGCTDVTEVNPPPLEENSIVFYGDTRVHHDVHMEMVDNIREIKPQAVFHLGDAVTDGGNAEEWVEFDKIVNSLRKTTSFYPVVGNHEKGVDQMEYATRWDMSIGQSYYSLDLLKNGELNQLPITIEAETDYTQTEIENVAAHLVVLNSMPGFLSEGEQQYQWLINDLLEYEGTPVILIFHIGMYMAGVHAEETGENHATPVLYDIVADERFNIVACINGHDHAYERFIVDGIQHIVTGCAGESPKDLLQPDHPFLIESETVHHMTVMQVLNDPATGDYYLQFNVYNIEREIIDSFSIELE